MGAVPVSLFLCIQLTVLRAHPFTVSLVHLGFIGTHSPIHSGVCLCTQSNIYIKVCDMYISFCAVLFKVHVIKLYNASVLFISIRKCLSGPDDLTKNLRYWHFRNVYGKRLWLYVGFAACTLDVPGRARRSLYYPAEPVGGAS